MTTKHTIVAVRLIGLDQATVARAIELLQAKLGEGVVLEGPQRGRRDWLAYGALHVDELPVDVPPAPDHSRACDHGKLPDEYCEACDPPHTDREVQPELIEMLITAHDGRAQFIVGAGGESDYQLLLTPAALRQHIAQCVRALAAIDPGDVAGQTDLEQLRLRYYGVNQAALEYSEARDQAVAQAAQLRRVLQKHEHTIACYARASELPEVRAALNGTAGQDLLSVAGAAERLVQQAPHLPAVAVYHSNVWQELVEKVEAWRARKEST